MPYTQHLENIKNAVSQLWNNPLHRHYTDHGIGHSERIKSKLEILLSNRSDLTPLEKFILFASCYLHDVGMQCINRDVLQTIAGINKEDNFPFNYAQLEKVRVKHAYLSYQIILDYINNGRERQNFNLNLNDVDFFIVHAIANICKAHCDPDYKSYCDESLVIAGVTVRIRLLAILLRLGDALDADTTRCNWNNYRTMCDSLSTFSQANFWKHRLVAGVEINNGLIRLVFSIPARYEKAKTGIVNMAAKPIHTHISDLKNVWRRDGLAIDIDVPKFQECPDFPDQMSEELERYFCRLPVMEKINQRKEIWQKYWETLIKDDIVDLEIGDSLHGKINCRSFLSASEEALDWKSDYAMLLLGDKGTGKSTLLKMLANQKAKDANKAFEDNLLTQEWLPILVDMEKFPHKEFGDLSGKDFLNIVYSMNPILKQLNQTDRLTEKDGILLLLDGLDKTDVKGESAIKRINLLKDLLGNEFRLIVTSRTEIFPHRGIFGENNPFDFSLKPVYIQNMTGKIVAQIVRYYLADGTIYEQFMKFVSNRYISDILKTPLELHCCLSYFPQIKQDINRFSDNSKLVLYYAFLEVENTKDKLMSTPHLFIALTKIEKGCTQRFLTSQGSDPRKIRNSLRIALMSQSILGSTQDTRFGISERFKNILTSALEYADIDKSNAVEEKHLLQAFFEHGGETKEILRDVLKIKIPEEKEEILHLFPEYTESAKRAWELAKEETRNHQHDLLTTPHLFIGLAKVENGFTQDILKRFKVDPKEISERLLSIMGKGKSRSNMELKISKRLMDILNNAGKVAGKESIDEKHLLWAIFKNGEKDDKSQTIIVFREFGLDPAKLMDEIGINES